jgi:ribosomal protein S18 acetylase RimI-like enzyme
MDHLTHGWEPELADSDTLLRRFVLASAHRSVELAERGGGRGEVRPTVSLADPASPIVFDNVAVLLQPPAYADLDTTVREVLAFYPAERHLMLLSAWPTPDLSGHGFELMGHPPMMFRPPGGQAPPPPDGLEIRAVRDERAHADFVTTLVEAYPMPGAEGTNLSDPALLDGPVRLFVGYVDGRPVATSGARLGHGIVDVEWVAARAEVRGRGIGAALTWAATLVEPDLPAVLIASDDGQPVYERMGYVRLLRLTLWHRPPAT